VKTKNDAQEREDGKQAQREERLESVYRQHAPDVQAYLVRRGLGAKAPEILSDVFLVAWRKIDQIPEDPLPWLLAVTRKTASNYRRGVRRQSALVGRLAAEPAPVALQYEDQDVASQSVLEALASLPQRDQEALMLVAWDGLRAREAARVLGCSPAAFRVRLHRARVKLSEALRERELTNACIVRRHKPAELPE
jgi:RNA polymerase sigma-70 factor (ECF subfamily)